MTSTLPPMPALVKAELPDGCDLTTEQIVWVKGRVVHVQLRIEMPASAELANIVFDAMRPVMAMSVEREPLHLETQHRTLDDDSAHVIFAYSWKGSATMAVWEIADALGEAMDIRRIMGAAFEHHKRYHVTTIEGLTPEVEDLTETESRRHHVHLQV